MYVCMHILRDVTSQKLRAHGSDSCSFCHIPCCDLRSRIYANSFTYNRLYNVYY